MPLLNYLFDLSQTAPRFPDDEDKYLIDSLASRPKLTFRCANSRMSLVILWAVAPKLASGASTSTSTLREYVCDDTGYANGNPESSVTRRSRDRT